MKLTLENAGSAHMVKGWDGTALRINDQRYHGTVMVAADEVLVMDIVTVASMDEAGLAPALARTPEILLVGTGRRQVFLPAALTTALARRGIGLEVMDTLAAARTYNVLVGEGRRVIAVLLAPDA